MKELTQEQRVLKELKTLRFMLFVVLVAGAILGALLWLKV